MNIAITGGGTGGHLSVANALKIELNKRGLKPIFIGSKNGQDREWFENDNGFKKSYFLDSKGVVNKKGFKKISAIKEILDSGFACRDIFKKEFIDVLFSVGGYSAAPASFAAILTKTPLFIHEQNAAVGKLNRLLKPFAKEFFSSYEENSKVKDYPVREIFFDLQRERSDLKTIIFLGGSLGANAINNLALSCAKEILDLDINIIHQTGKKDFSICREFYNKNNLKVDCFDFSKNLEKKIQKADFAVSRAGASTLWELCANTLPTLFIPYPYAASNHQYYNAKTLIDKEMALLRMQNEIDSKILLDIIKSVNIEKISKNLKNSIKPCGIEKIADIILK